LSLTVELGPGDLAGAGDWGGNRWTERPAARL